jgi:hypothetical protein
MGRGVRLCLGVQGRKARQIVGGFSPGATFPPEVEKPLSRDTHSPYVDNRPMLVGGKLRTDLETAADKLEARLARAVKPCALRPMPELVPA